MGEIYYHQERISPNQMGFQAIKFFKRAVDINGTTVVRDYISVDTPGVTGSTVLVMTDKLKNRYAKEYNQWKEKGEAGLSGIPLSESGVFDSETCALLAEEKIYTLEQIANAPESFCINAKLRGYRDRAKTILDAKKASSTISGLESQVKVLEEEIKELRQNYRVLLTEKGASEEAKVSDESSRKRAVAKSK